MPWILRFFFSIPGSKMLKLYKRVCTFIKYLRVLVAKKALFILHLYWKSYKGHIKRPWKSFYSIYNVIKESV